MSSSIKERLTYVHIIYNVIINVQIIFKQKRRIMLILKSINFDKILVVEKLVAIIEHFFHANCLFCFNLIKLPINYKSRCVINDSNFVEAGREWTRVKKCSLVVS